MVSTAAYLGEPMGWLRALPELVLEALRIRREWVRDRARHVLGRLRDAMRKAKESGDTSGIEDILRE